MAFTINVQEKDKLTARLFTDECQRLLNCDFVKHRANCEECRCAQYRNDKGLPELCSCNRELSDFNETSTYVMCLRTFLPGESLEFRKILNSISRLYKTDHKELKREISWSFNFALKRSGLGVRMIGERSGRMFPSEKTLQTYLNANYFHRDIDKIREIDNWRTDYSYRISRLVLSGVLLRLFTPIIVLHDYHDWLRGGCSNSLPWKNHFESNGIHFSHA